jgi:hypothetical protein
MGADDRFVRRVAVVRSQLRGGAAAVTALFVLSGCTPAPVACTQIGSSPGVGVTVVRELARDVEALKLTVCFGGSCRTVPVEVVPGSSSVPLDCPSDAPPDTSCSATAVPDGTLVGFAEVPDLVEGRVDIGASLTRNRRQRTYARVPVEARPTYPNGRQCPPGGVQAQVRITPMGVVG